MDVRKEYLNIVVGEKFYDDIEDWLIIEFGNLSLEFNICDEPRPFEETDQQKMRCEQIINIYLGSIAYLLDKKTKELKIDNLIYTPEIVDISNEPIIISVQEGQTLKLLKRITKKYVYNDTPTYEW